MIQEEDIIEVGKFHKTHALKGELNAILSVNPQYFEEGNPLIVMTDGILVPYYVDSIRNKGQFSYLVKIIGVNNEEEAIQFVNKEILMLKSDAEEWLDEPESLSEDLIGYSIIDASTGKEIGIIDYINNTTENILFSIKKDDDEFYIPASEDLISEIDVDRKYIIMKLPEGLLDINKK